VDSLRLILRAKNTIFLWAKSFDKKELKVGSWKTKNLLEASSVRD